MKVLSHTNVQSLLRWFCWLKGPTVKILNLYGSRKGQHPYSVNYLDLRSCPVNRCENMTSGHKLQTENFLFVIRNYKFHVPHSLLDQVSVVTECCNSLVLNLQFVYSVTYTMHYPLVSSPPPTSLSLSSGRERRGNCSLFGCLTPRCCLGHHY